MSTTVARFYNAPANPFTGLAAYLLIPLRLLQSPYATHVFMLAVKTMHLRKSLHLMNGRSALKFSTNVKLLQKCCSRSSESLEASHVTDNKKRLTHFRLCLEKNFPVQPLKITQSTCK